MGEGRCRCCCMSYQTRVLIFAATNVLVTGLQLFLPLISSAFILYFQATRQHFEAKYVLHQETISLFHRIPAILLQPHDSSQVSISQVGGTGSPLQSDLHVWASWVFLRAAAFLYAILLYNGTRKRNGNMVMAWFALNAPMAAHSLMVLGLDFGLGLMRKKPLNFQVFQVALSVYQLLGLLFVFFFLRRRTQAAQTIRGVRYPDFKRDTDGKFRDPASLHL